MILRHNLTLDPIVALTLGVVNSHYTLSFCEVSLNLLQ